MSATGNAARGFTLIEMLVVLAVLGLIGGLAWPVLGRAVTGQQFNVATATVVAALRDARGQAIAGDTPAWLRVADDHRRFGAASIPAGIEVRTEPAAGIGFFGDGSSTGGSAVLRSRERQVRLVVAPATGLVSTLPVR